MRIKSTDKITKDSNLVVVAFSVKDVKSDPLFKSLDKEDKKYALGILGKSNPPSRGSISFRLPSNTKRTALIIGLGQKKDWNKRKFFLASRRIVFELKASGIDSALVSLDSLSLHNTSSEELANLFAQNAIIADYKFSTHKVKPKGGLKTIQQIDIYSSKNNGIDKGLMEGEIIGNAVNICRELANTPGGIMTPTKLANEAKKLFARSRVKIKVFDKNRIEKLGMGGVLGVSSGSSEKPKFIVMEYGPSSQKPIVFVGKGITFDSGGIDIKPSGRATDMKMDMSGGAAVITAILAISKMRLNVHVIGLVPAAENMPSGSSYRPGDILKTITGKTIEVVNTDAEGRVILADALGYAQRYKPSLIVDIATLTGGAMVALGGRANAVFSNREKLLEYGKEIGEKTGDFAWPLPAWDEYDEEIEGSTGDFANSGKYHPNASAISGAVFLKQFIGKYPWMHLDIAPMMTSIDGQYLERGATGTGVRFLIEIAKSFK